MNAFHFRVVPFIVTLLLTALGCSLAYWQMQRAHQKEQIETKLQQREHLPAMPLPEAVAMPQMEYAKVMLTGEFDPRWPIYLDNRPMNSKVGIDVVMPFKLHLQNKYVLVLRGWIPRNNQDRAAIKAYATPSGTIQIEGVIKAHSPRVFQLGASVPLQPNALIQNLEVEEFERASQLPTYPFIVEQTQGNEDGLLRDWPRASAGAERHRAYAFQWLALAIAALLFFIVTGFKRIQK
jgi:cytochrome oxidase assembly protein ShyY1